MQTEQQSFFDVQLLAGAFTLAFVLDEKNKLCSRN